MRIKMTSEQSGENKDIVYISILLTIALCVGVYLISTTVLIAKDGVTFIEYAKKLETEPIKTMVNEYQHPGYPSLILAAHKITKLLYEGMSIWRWIYCAQSVALIFRLLTVAALYFVGKEIVGPKLSFLAILILILLPKPAKYGSDALSDWPYLFFLATGFLMLIHGAIHGKWWLFGFAGLAAGIGYLIRPECAQLVVFGFLWLGLQLFWRKRTVSRGKAVFALALLLVGFLVTAGPYMKLKGAIFPKKQIGQFVSNLQPCEVYEQETRFRSSTVYAAGFTSSDVARAFGRLAEKIGDMLMWFFVPALLIGTYKYFRERNWHEPEKFFIIALIALNVPMMIWLYCKHGYISGRHILPLVVFTIFHAPTGLQVLASWLQGKFSKKTEQSPVMKSDSRFWFLTLFVIGISVCIPKLLTPVRTKKQNLRDAAQWLAKHTDEKDIIAAPDMRISFYAQRKGLEYKAGQIPEKAQYIVRIFKKEIDEAALLEKFDKTEYRYVDKRNDKARVVIYRNL